MPDCRLLLQLISKNLCLNLALMEWKPVMTSAEADDWAGSSVYSEVAYHITSQQNVASLEQFGFDLHRVKFGRVWGNGVYAAIDNRTAQLYLTWQGYDATILELRLNLQRIFTYDASQTGTRGMPYVIANQLSQGTIRYNELLMQINQRNSELRQRSLALPVTARKEFLLQKGYESFAEAAALSLLLQEHSYDALLITDRADLTTAVGGNQIVVFNPQNVVIIK